MTPQVAQSSENGSGKLTLGAIWGHFWSQKLNIATLLKHYYLVYFQPKIQFWDHLMPSRTRAYGNLSACLATEADFFVSFGLLAGLEGANWVSEGPQMPPKRDPKMTQNRLEIHPGGPWHAQGCQGVPPRCLRSSQHAFLCIFCAYLCIFMHILCIFMHVFISFMHIYTYCCTCNSFLCIFMNI